MLRLLLVLILLAGSGDVPPRLTPQRPAPFEQASLTQRMAFANAGQIAGLCAAAETAGDGQFDMCLGYLAGSIDQLVTQHGIGAKASRPLCPSAAVSLDEYRRKFVLYVELNPELNKAAAAPVIARAVLPALSCDLFPMGAR
jgi:hypothetical protein